MAEPPPNSAVQATSGEFVPDGDFVIALRTSEGNAAPGPVRYVVEHGLGRTAGIAEPEAAGDGAWRLVVPMTPEIAPVKSISLESHITLAPDLARYMAGMFPRDDADFEKTFLRAAHRYGDRHTLYVTARQIARHFEGRHAYRCCAAVVMAYKAMELGGPLLGDEALAELATCVAGIEACEITLNPRTNREHLLASVLCAKWHVELGLERWQTFMETLEATSALSTGLSNYFTPAYPISCSMLVLAVIQNLRGHSAEVETLALAGLKLFQRAVSDARFSSVLFQELSVSHQNVAAMIKLAKDAPPPAVQDMERLLHGALRVSGKQRQVFANRIIQFGTTGR